MMPDGNGERKEMLSLPLLPLTRHPHRIQLTIRLFHSYTSRAPSTAPHFSTRICEEAFRRGTHSSEIYAHPIDEAHLYYFFYFLCLLFLLMFKDSRGRYT